MNSRYSVICLVMVTFFVIPNATTAQDTNLCENVGSRLSPSELTNFISNPVLFGQSRLGVSWLQLAYEIDEGRIGAIAFVDTEAQVFEMGVEGNKLCEYYSYGKNCSFNHHCGDIPGSVVSILCASEDAATQGSMSSPEPFRSKINSEGILIDWFEGLLEQIDGKSPVLNIADVMLLDELRATRLLANGARIAMTLENMAFDNGYFILENIRSPTTLVREGAVDLAWRGLPWDEETLWRRVKVVCHVPANEMPEVQQGAEIIFDAELKKVSSNEQSGMIVRLECS